MKKSATYSSTTPQGHKNSRQNPLSGTTYGMVCIARAMQPDFSDYPCPLFEDDWEPGPLRSDFPIGRRG